MRRPNRMTFTDSESSGGKTHATAKICVGGGDVFGAYFTLVALCGRRGVTNELDLTKDERVDCDKCLAVMGVR